MLLIKYSQKIYKELSKRSKYFRYRVKKKNTSKLLFQAMKYMWFFFRFFFQTRETTEFSKMERGIIRIVCGKQDKKKSSIEKVM